MVGALQIEEDVDNLANEIAGKYGVKYDEV